MPKAPASPKDRAVPRHNPLSEEYAPTQPFKEKCRKKRKLSPAEKATNDYVDTKASHRILRIGQDLVEEAEHETKALEPNPAFALESRHPAEEDESKTAGQEFDDEDDGWGDEDEVAVEEVEVDPNDQDVFNRFHPTGDDPSTIWDPATRDKPSEESSGTNLADLILEKIKEHEAATEGQDKHANDGHDDPLVTENPDDEQIQLPPQVVECYIKVGHLMSRYRSGPIPKPFKILPTLPPDQIPILLDITNPSGWTPHAHFAAVKLFISSKPAIAQPYLHDVLLPTVRDSIAEDKNKRLNVHLYDALRKSLYRPAAFFKGLLFPLLEGDDCTLREAHIIGSVLARVSVPVLHSAAALLRLCDIAARQFSAARFDGGGSATNVFIRILLEKKYALPYKVVDSLVFHFVRFKALKSAAKSRANCNDAMEDVEMMDESSGKISGPNLPVVWHRSFLAFAQRYRNDITEDQREALLDVITAVGHKQMGPEIRRELLEGRGRGVPAQETSTGGLDFGGDDTMMSIG
ncbi:MAG: snoRNA-binding rRNA-processing protein [Alyxoria varia]|nr:MAG: snoRNA-binding rRNA-processing protein [Alyxoria varia]